MSQPYCMQSGLKRRYKKSKDFRDLITPPTPAAALSTNSPIYSQSSLSIITPSSSSTLAALNQPPQEIALRPSDSGPSNYNFSPRETIDSSKLSSFRSDTSKLPTPSALTGSTSTTARTSASINPSSALTSKLLEDGKQTNTASNIKSLPATGNSFVAQNSSGTLANSLQPQDLLNTNIDPPNDLADSLVGSGMTTDASNPHAPAVPLGGAELPFQQAQDLHFPNVGILVDSSLTAEDRLYTFGDQMKDFLTRLFYIFFLPISWFFTFAHSIQMLIIRIMFLPARVTIQYYERTIRVKIPWLPSFLGMLNYLFPNGINFPSFQDILVILFPPPKDVIPPLDVDFSALGTGNPVFKLQGSD